MNRIRLLPEHVANQIAAGEVVERPASVVKELVENALDAQATRLTVEIQAGGRSLIRVTDDGLGMSRDDALLCLERHATSKIQRAEDLSAITTMGFRGEALPSIASVSRLSLTTREQAGGLEGTQVVVHGGRIQDVKSAGSPPGTCVEVRQLFFNLPARRKFLRSEETEYAHVHHYLTLAALAYPEVAFTLIKDGRVIWQLPAVPCEPTVTARLASLRERLRALLGSADSLIPLDVSFELPPSDDEMEAGVEGSAESLPGCPSPRLWGFMGQPGLSRATRQDQHVFVNRRPVENRGLNYALLEGYHTALMKGRYPVCCLFLELDPSEVDVNIHPSKREVKFHREKAIVRLVTQAVRQALIQQGIEAAPAVPPPPPAPAKSQAVAVPAASVQASPAPTPRELPGFTGLAGTRLEAWQNVARRPSVASPAAQEPAPLKPAPAMNLIKPAASSPPAATSLMPPPSVAVAEPTPLLKVPLRLVGVVGRLYVVLESDRGLVLMDQHAAHERILFEQMLDRLEQGAAPSQRLLLPETVELSVRDAHFLREQLPVLNRLGVGLSEFGERTYLLDALPPVVKVADPRRFVLELVDELKAAGQEVNSMRLGEHTVAKTVCRHAVKANDPLAGPELEQLVQDLRQCAMPYTCPHGRPTLIEMNFRELEKKFGRLV
jgi:DNA mismatch repair protein MutL